MTSIRERQKVILWAFLLIFLLSISIGGLVGGADLIDQIFGSNLAGNAVGAVNKDRITIEELSQAISMQTQQAREQYGELSDRLLDQVENQAWEGLVNLVLWNSEIESRRIAPTGEQIFHILENYPPQFLLENEAFQTDGEFDPALYYQALHNPTGSEWAPVEAYLASVIPGENIRQLVLANAYVSKEEVKAAWYDKNTDVTFDYLYLSTGKIPTDSLLIDEGQLRAIHRREREQFWQPETRILEYVVWPKVPNREDTLEVLETANDLIERAKAGEDFAQIALTYSEDPGSGPDSGNLGWFGKGQMVKPFEDAAFGAQVGDIVGPVQSQFGFHVIKVEDRREDEEGEKVNARHVLLKVNISPQSHNSLRSQANIFSFDAVDSGFTAALQIHGQKGLTSPPLVIEDKYLPPPAGRMRAAVRFAFAAEETGQVSDVFENENAYMVVQLSDIRPAGVQPMSAVRDRLVRIAWDEETKRRVSMKMAKAQKLVSAGADLQAVADSIPLIELRTDVTQKLNQMFSGIGHSPILKGVLKAMEPGEVSGIVELERGEAIIRLIGRQEPEWERYAMEWKAEYDRFLTRRLNSIFEDWLADIREEANIIDNRHAFY
ncbi:MAG: peptidylprolyl isomerase [Fidelibacterota bacterium]|nr:MAG: peptidylprolyl isomerase [Candidatus Neomarinimicrobiota bacterium]